jgi:hypothetical protein
MQGVAASSYSVYVVVSTSHDPNWFYFAQSTAAIVGLAGGFLVSRLIARRAEIGVERASLATSFASIVGEFAGEANRYEEAGSWPSSQRRSATESPFRPGWTRVTPADP